MKILLVILLLGITTLIGYFGYQYYYVETLKVTEIVGKSEDNLTNIALNFLDFDTGLTRNDLRKIKSSKDYWMKRITEVDSIQDPEKKASEYEKLINELLEDPSLKKIFKGTMAKSYDFIKSIFQVL
jgi:hypothetical protein